MSPSFCSGLSQPGRSCGLEQQCRELGLPGLWLGLLCPGREGRGSPWNPPKPCFGTAKTAEQKSCSSQPLSPLFSLLLLFLQYRREARRLFCSLKKERRNKYFYVAKIFILPCILKTCTAHSRSASVSHLCCMKQPRGWSYTWIQAADKSLIIELHHFWLFFLHTAFWHPNMSSAFIEFVILQFLSKLGLWDPCSHTRFQQKAL